MPIKSYRSAKLGSGQNIPGTPTVIAASAMRGSSIRNIGRE